MRSNLRLSLVFGIATLGVSGIASAFDREYYWDGASTASFPVIPVDGCTYKLGQLFSGFPTGNIINQARSAMNEWFVHGDADVRLRYRSDITTDTDPRCTGAFLGLGGNGSVVLTADQYDTGATGKIAVTSWGLDPANGMHIKGAKVILFRNLNQMGTITPISWATNADAPSSSQLDFQYVLLHELGHVLGLQHSTVLFSVMAPSGVNGLVRRTIGFDDAQGLTASSVAPPYGTIQTNLFDAWTPDHGVSWGTDQNGTAYAVGGGATCIDNYGPSASYFGAFTRSDHVVQTFNYFFGYSAGGTISGASSILPPGVACGSAGEKIISWVDAATENISYQTNTSGTWSATSTLNAFYHSSIPPMVQEYSPGRYLMVFASDPYGEFVTATAPNGLTFGSVTIWSTLRTFHPGGLACTGGFCLVAITDPLLNSSSVQYVEFAVDASGVVSYLTGPVTLTNAPQSYGAEVQFDSSSGIEFLWRDRGTNTVLTSSADIGSTLHFSSIVTQSPPKGTWSNYYSTFAEWFSYSARYDHF